MLARDLGRRSRCNQAASPDPTRDRRLRPCARTAPSPATSSASGTSSTPPTSCSAASPARPPILLRGKHKPIFAPHVDTGDFVIIINADKVALTGDKREQKLAYRHSGYPGGLQLDHATPSCSTSDPTQAVEKAVRGMLPKNSLGRADAQEAQGLRRARAPARGAAARAVRDHPGRAVVAPPTRSATRATGLRRTVAETTARRPPTSRPTTTSTTSTPRPTPPRPPRPPRRPAARASRPPAGDRPPQGGHRPRAHRPGHRPVDDQRPHARRRTSRTRCTSRSSTSRSRCSSSTARTT